MVRHRCVTSRCGWSAVERCKFSWLLLLLLPVFGSRCSCVHMCILLEYVQVEVSMNEDDEPEIELSGEREGQPLNVANVPVIITVSQVRQHAGAGAGNGRSRNKGHAHVTRSYAASEAAPSCMWLQSGWKQQAFAKSFASVESGVSTPCWGCLMGNNSFTVLSWHPWRATYVSAVAHCLARVRESAVGALLDCSSLACWQWSNTGLPRAGHCKSLFKNSLPVGLIPPKSQRLGFRHKLAHHCVCPG